MGICVRSRGPAPAGPIRRDNEGRAEGGGAMSTATVTTTWTIELRFEEDPSHCHSVAILRTPGGRELRGHGTARRNPVDRPVARIGEEVAGARALSNLAHELLEYAANEIELNVRRGDPVP